MSTLYQGTVLPRASSNPQSTAMRMCLHLPTQYSGRRPNESFQSQDRVPVYREVRDNLRIYGKTHLLIFLLDRR